MEKDYKYERFISLLVNLLLKYGPQVLEKYRVTEQCPQEEQK